MTDAKVCPTCGLSNDLLAKFCRDCGGDLQAVGVNVSLASGAPKSIITETKVDWRWVAGGVGIMFGSQFVLGLLLGAMQVRLGLGGLLLIGLLSFALGGFLVGYFSKNKTIIEPGIAAAIASILASLISGPHNFLGLLFGAALVFLAGLFGGWLGEKVTGTV